MKKTISTLLALGSCAAAFAATEAITITPQVTPAIGSGDIATIHGWQQSLQSASLSAPSATLTETVNLLSVGIMTAKDVQNTNLTTKLAIYTGEEISASTFVGISTNVVTYAVDSTFTFNFEGVVLDSSTSYTFRFVTEASTAESQTDGHFRVSMSKKAHGSDESIMPYGGAQDWQPNYSPYAVYTVSNVTPSTNVPEPTTATLSLLALAGLAARRRRK